MNSLRKIIIFLLFAVALLPTLIPRPLPQKNKQFCLEAITAQIPFHPEWETRALSEDESQNVAQALSQSYRYLGSGGQCFSFVSSDNQYVIKFIKQKAFAIPIWIEHSPVSFLTQWLHEKKELKRQAKRNRVFTAFKLCFDLLSTETGLIYVHLNPTKHLKTTLSFCDSLGDSHLLDLDGLEFIIQKKADLTYDTLDALMQTADIEKAQQAIDQLIALNLKLFQKGFLNRDPNFRSNCGFINGKAILIDVGRVVYCEPIKQPENYKKELMRVTPKFRLYLSQRHPQLLSYFDQAIAEIRD